MAWKKVGKTLIGVTLFSLGSFIKLESSQAEGTFQITNGATNTYQSLFDYDSNYSDVVNVGLTQTNRPLFLDVETNGIINVAACGLNFTDDWSVQIVYHGPNYNSIGDLPSYDDYRILPNEIPTTNLGQLRIDYPDINPGIGTSVFTSATFTQGSFNRTASNSCNNPANVTSSQLDLNNNGLADDGNIAKYNTNPGAGGQGPGLYEIRLRNLTNTSNSGDFRQFDISLTPNTTTLPNPTASPGRLWSYIWTFDADSFAATQAIDSNLYIVVPGGFLGTNYIWELDFDSFAGNVYELSANDLGLESISIDGNRVFGQSASIRGETNLSTPDPVSPGGNSINPMYRQYLSFPNTNTSVNVIGPDPSSVPIIQNFRFEDEDGVDNTISPGNTAGVQDQGFFKFTPGQAGTYEIIIDIDDDGNEGNGFNPDGLFGVGDVFLKGTTDAGVELVIPWAGTSNNGTALPEGIYQAQLKAIIGEYHFTAGDAETSGGANDGSRGIRVNNARNAAPVPNYWDDITGLQDPNGTTSLPGGTLNPLTARHGWGSYSGTGFGNKRYLDTYVFGDFTIAETPAILYNSGADPDFPSYDFGDAPDTYGTNKDTAIGGVGAAHNLDLFANTTVDLYLGNVQTAGNTDGIPSVNADGDDIDSAVPPGDGIDDEDGVTFNTALTTTASSYSVDVRVFNNAESGNPATLIGWIDFNQDGDFLDPGEEAILTGIPISGIAQDVVLTWNNIDTNFTLTPGNTYARFRVSTEPTFNSASDAVGVFNDGEVEDYPITISNPRDFGDAPDTYGTNLANGGEGVGASHIPNPNLFIGSSAPDSEPDGLPNANATGDDANNTLDENPADFSFPALTTANTSYSITVPLTNTLPAGPPSFAVVAGWIDFNGNGTFEAGEGATANITNANTSATLTWNGITPVAGNTFVRLRINQGAASMTTANFNGALGSGEVEDHQITVVAPTANPDLNPNFCSTTANILFILDESGSINATEQQNQRDGVQATLQYMVDNGITGNAAITSFATTGVDRMGGAPFYYPISQTNVDGVFNTALTAYGSGGQTRWEEGWNTAANSSFASGVNPDVVFFFTDGAPNLPIIINDTPAVESEIVSNIAQAIPAANQFKAIGAHIYGINVEASPVAAGSRPQPDPQALFDDFDPITDPGNITEYVSTINPATTGSPAPNASQADYVDITNYAQLATEFLDFFTDICPGTEYGDAPDTGAGTGLGNYETLDANGGANHVILPDLRIGAETDNDDGTLQNAAADADDTNNTGSVDDEDGLPYQP
ncbi:MAG: VWA domain-containing protein [Synechococcaceae cyanobacterium RL_1_2]|nr:VWA domain-containing protein [Synechococcaceae cyanobacterium RL_1_2]